MKNIIILFFLFLFLFIPKTISAVGGGVFYCQYWGPTGECIVDSAIPACDPGFTSNPSSCSSLGINECDGSYFDCVPMYEKECYECDSSSFQCFSVPPEKYGGNCPYTNKLTCDTDCVALPGEANYRCYNDGCRKADDGPYSSYGDCYDACTFYQDKTRVAENSLSDIECSVDGKKGIDTAIGCIPIENSNALISFILKWAIGVGGGIAFLLIVLAGFQIMTSAGNPDRLKAGQELMTSAIAGLVLLIFSVFILKIIGVDILKLPGFGQ